MSVVGVEQMEGSVDRQGVCGYDRVNDLAADALVCSRASRDRRREAGRRQRHCGLSVDLSTREDEGDMAQLLRGGDVLAGGVDVAGGAAGKLEREDLGYHVAWTAKPR